MSPVRPRFGASAGGAGPAAAIMLAAACGASAPTLELDGWATGAFLEDCTAAPATEDCDRLVMSALTSLDDGRERRSIKVYEEGPYTDASGDVKRLDRGDDPIVIVVVTYADGARRAVGVYCAATIEGQPPPACSVMNPPFN